MRLSSLPSRPTLTAHDLHEAIAQSTRREQEVDYRIRRPGGTIVGPLRLAKMLEMIATARAGVDTQVSRSGGPFLALSSVYELARLASRPSYRFFDPVALLATERSNITRFTLPSKLYTIALERRRP